MPRFSFLIRLGVLSLLFRLSSSGSDLPAPFHANGVNSQQAQARAQANPPPISEYRHVVSLRHEESLQGRLQDLMSRLSLPLPGVRLNARDNCVGILTDSTPYDRYLSPIHQVFANLGPPGAASMERVEGLMSVGRKFRYQFNEPYTAALPERTAERHRGDCKSKSLWLCYEMGDSSVRFVVGRLHARSRMQHAWLYWRHSGRWWILDCTTRNRPIPADSVASDEYIPYYSYDREGAYRHRATEMIMASGIPAVPDARSNAAPALRGSLN
jgi:hypothetical protein